ELAQTNRCLQTTQILQVMEEMCEQTQCPMSSLGSGQNLKRKITEARVKAHGKYSLGESVLDLNIPASLQLTTKNERFLLHDSGAGPKRLVVFAAAEDLDRLSYCHTWKGHLHGAFQRDQPQHNR
ncbi:unnamed protein product, partial [Allacma fusca]